MRIEELLKPRIAVKLADSAKQSLSGEPISDAKDANRRKRNVDIERHLLGPIDYKKLNNVVLKDFLEKTGLSGEQVALWEELVDWDLLGLLYDIGLGRPHSIKVDDNTCIELIKEDWTYVVAPLLYESGDLQALAKLVAKERGVSTEGFDKWNKIDLEEYILEFGNTDKTIFIEAAERFVDVMGVEAKKYLKIPDNKFKKYKKDYERLVFDSFDGRKRYSTKKDFEEDIDMRKEIISDSSYDDFVIYYDLDKGDILTLESFVGAGGYTLNNFVTKFDGEYAPFDGEKSRLIGMVEYIYKNKNDIVSLLKKLGYTGSIEGKKPEAIYNLFWEVLGKAIKEFKNRNDNEEVIVEYEQSLADSIGGKVKIRFIKKRKLNDAVDVSVIPLDEFSDYNGLWDYEGVFLRLFDLIGSDYKDFWENYQRYSSLSKAKAALKKVDEGKLEDFYKKRRKGIRGLLKKAGETATGDVINDLAKILVYLSSRVKQNIAAIKKNQRR